MTRLFRHCLLGLIFLAITLSASWASLALWYRLPFGEHLRGAMAAGFALLALAVLIGLFRPRRLRALATYCLALAAVLTWWITIPLPTNRTWSPDVARQVTGTLQGSQLTLTDVRNFTWRSPDDFDVNWETRRYDLDTLQSVDLFLSYWSGQTIAHMIVSFGYNVHSAHSGLDAMDMIESGLEFDALITDIVMPGGMSGFDLAATVRAQRPDVPVIYMSGYAAYTDQEMGVVVAPLLQKPCSPFVLSQYLSEALAEAPEE